MIQSRREFLKTAGKVAVAASVASALPMSAMAEAPAHPFTYVHLDPEKAADRAYAAFTKLGGCCVSVADAGIHNNCAARSMHRKILIIFFIIHPQYFHRGLVGR